MDRTNKLAQLLVLVMLGVILFISKWILQLLPNIELVSLLLMVYTYKFGIKALIPTYIFVALEILIYGINIWNVMYLYVWAVLVFVCLPLRKIRKGWLFAIIGGLFGLCFGALCSIPYFFTLGAEFALSWVVSGFWFDLIHAGGNFLTALLLYMPLTKALDRITQI